VALTQQEELHRDVELILGLVNNVLELQMLGSTWLSGVAGLQKINWKGCRTKANIRDLKKIHPLMSSFKCVVYSKKSYQTKYIFLKLI
jgi:hypothetical protein